MNRKADAIIIHNAFWAAPMQGNIHLAILLEQLPALRLLLEYGGECDSCELLRSALDNFMIL